VSFGEFSMKSSVDGDGDLGGGGDKVFVSSGNQNLALLPQPQIDERTAEPTPLSLWTPDSGVLPAEGQGLVESHIQTETGLYPISALFPVDVSKLPAQQLIKEQEVLLGTTSVTGMKHLPDFQCLDIPDTVFSNQVFDQAIEAFQANYGELGGWKDAIRLGIKYAAAEIVRLVETRAIPVNNRVFGFGLNDWEQLRKVTGVGIVP